MRLLASLIGFSSASLYPFEGLKREIFENHLKMWDTFRDPATGLYCDNVYSNSAHKCGNYLNAPWYANWYSSAATGWVARQLRKSIIARRKFAQKDNCVKGYLRKETIKQTDICAEENLRKRTISQRDNCFLWHIDICGNRLFYAIVTLSNCSFAKLFFCAIVLQPNRLGPPNKRHRS